MTDYGEPYSHGHNYSDVLDSDGDLIAVAMKHRDRIVACVNYCKGMSTERLNNRARRAGEPYGVKSLRMIREAIKRGMHIDTGNGMLVLPTGKIHDAKPQDGRNYVHLGIDGDTCSISLARITCYLIYGEPPDETYVADHIDGNTLNDYYTNIRWASRSENLLGAKAYEEELK